MSNKTPEASANATELAHKSHHIALLAVSVLIAVLVVAISWYRSEVEAPFAEFASTTVRLNDHVLQAEIADTHEKRRQGLSGRDGIGDNQAMLFVFEQAGEYCFWMKDVDFPIDMLWFDSQKQLVYSQQSVDPDSYPTSFCPPEPAMYVLELASGRAEELNVSPETQLEVNNL